MKTATEVKLKMLRVKNMIIYYFLNVRYYKFIKFKYFFTSYIKPKFYFIAGTVVGMGMKANQ